MLRNLDFDFLKMFDAPTEFAFVRC